MDLKQSVTAIQHANEQGLTISNPVVVAIAQRLRVNTPRFIERTQECLPTVVEQQFYLALAADQAMKPETFSRVLRMFVGDRNLGPQDLDRRETSPNIFASRFDNIADFVIGVVELCNKEQKELGGYQVSFNSAAKLLLEYGSVENVEAVIDSIIADLGDVQQKLRIKNTDPEIIVAKALNLLVNKIIPECHVGGRTVPLRFMDYYEQEDGVLLAEEV